MNITLTKDQIEIILSSLTLYFPEGKEGEVNELYRELVNINKQSK